MSDSILDWPNLKYKRFTIYYKINPKTNEKPAYYNYYVYHLDYSIGSRGEIIKQQGVSNLKTLFISLKKIIDEKYNDVVWLANFPDHLDRSHYKIFETEEEAKKAIFQYNKENLNIPRGWNTISHEAYYRLYIRKEAESLVDDTAYYRDFYFGYSH